MKYFFLSLFLSALLYLPLDAQSVELLGGFGVSGLGNTLDLSSPDADYTMGFQAGFDTQLGISSRIRLDKNDRLGLRFGAAYQHSRYSFEIFAHHFSGLPHNVSQVSSSIITRNHNFQFNNLLIPVSLSTKWKKFEFGTGIITTLPVFTQLDVIDEFGHDVQSTSDLKTNKTTLKSKFESDPTPFDNTLIYRNPIQFQYLLYFNYQVDAKWRIGLSYQDHIRAGRSPLYGLEVHNPLFFRGVVQLSDYEYRTGTLNLTLYYTLK